MQKTPPRQGSARLVVAGLLLLSAVPFAAGIVRLRQLATGIGATPQDARFFDAPLPYAVHIIAALVFSALGAFQFFGGTVPQRPAWHRFLGRLLVPAGLTAAVSGLWITYAYQAPDGGVGLYVLRMIFGSAMALCLLLGVAALMRRDYREHRNWMMRGYAIGLGAGTQVLTHLPWFILYGTPDELPRVVLMGAGWVINVIVVEWIIASVSRRERHAAAH